MSMLAQRVQPGASTGLASHFYETREDQARRALVEAVTRQPDTTMAELAAFVEQHPELRGMTLDELLERVRRDLARQAPSLETWLARVDRASQWTRIPRGPSWPEVHVSGEAARRIRGHEHAIADVVAQVTREAERLGLAVEHTTIYADKVMDGGGVIVNFRVDTAGDHQALWDHIAMIEPGLPIEVWLTLS